MKILFLTRLYYPHQGGVEKHIEKVSQKLQKKGHEITIVTTKHDPRLPNREMVHGNKIIRFDQPDIKFIGIIYTWVWMIQNIALFKQSDIVHVHDVFIWYWPLLFLLPRKKVFTTIHGQWGKYPISMIDKLQKRIASKYSTGILSIGEYLPKNYAYKKDLVSYGAADSPKKTNKKKKDRVLYVGRLDETIPVRKIFKVFAKLKGMDIKILGDGPLKYDAKKYGKVVGGTDPTPYYKIGKFVFASGYLTIIEALSNKCLVFAVYENPLQKDYYSLTPFKDLVISADDPEKLASKLKYFQKNPKEADLQIEKGNKWARKQTWEKMTDSYEKLWQRK